MFKPSQLDSLISTAVHSGHSHLQTVHHIRSHYHLVNLTFQSCCYPSGPHLLISGCKTQHGSSWNSDFRFESHSSEKRIFYIRSTALTHLHSCWPVCMIPPLWAAVQSKAHMKYEFRAKAERVFSQTNKQTNLQTRTISEKLNMIMIFHLLTSSQSPSSQSPKWNIHGRHRILSLNHLSHMHEFTLSLDPKEECFELIRRYVFITVITATLWCGEKCSSSDLASRCDGKQSPIKGASFSSKDHSSSIRDIQHPTPPVLILPTHPL